MLRTTTAGLSVAAALLGLSCSSVPEEAVARHGNLVELESKTALEDLTAMPGVVVVDFYADW